MSRRRVGPCLAGVAVLAAAMALPGDGLPGLDRNKRIEIMKGVVLIVSLKRQDGKLVPVGRGSGSIISTDGLILTNNHVIADPKSGELQDMLAVGLTTSFDKIPRPTCLALPSRAVRDTELDLAIIKCEAEVNGQPLRRALSWPAVTIGDSKGVVPGDDLYIVGYPAIGGMTITFSAGKTGGFLEDDKGSERAWIKTDALISPGVSGGAAFDDEGKLIGVPTQLRWQSGGRTNLGMVRPIEHARSLVASVQGKDWSSVPRAAAPTPAPAGGGRVQLGPLTVRGGLDEAQVSQTIQGRLPALGSCYQAALQRSAGTSGHIEASLVIGGSGAVLRATATRTSLTDQALTNCTLGALRAASFPSYKGELAQAQFLVLFFASPARAPPAPPEKPQPPEKPEPPPPPSPSAGSQSYVSGQLVDASNGHAIVGAAVLVLKAGVQVGELNRDNLAASTATVAVSTSLGYFRTRHALPHGFSYGLVIVAKGYRPVAVNEAVQLPAGTSTVHSLGVLRLQPLGY